MVKSVEDWRKNAHPTTPSQINKFFELCVEWALRQESYGEDDVIDSIPHQLTQNTPSDGVTDEDSLLSPIRKCIICDNQTDISVNANPFTHAHLIYVCKTCYE